MSIAFKKMHNWMSWAWKLHFTCSFNNHQSFQDYPSFLSVQVLFLCFEVEVSKFSTHKKQKETKRLSFSKKETKDSQAHFIYTAFVLQLSSNCTSDDNHIEFRQKESFKCIWLHLKPEWATKFLKLQLQVKLTLDLSTIEICCKDTFSSRPITYRDVNISISTLISDKYIDNSSLLFIYTALLLEGIILLVSQHWNQWIVGIHFISNSHGKEKWRLWSSKLIYQLWKCVEYQKS